MSIKPITRIGIVVGEPSGDLLGSELVKALKVKFPDAEMAGIAGPQMQEQGVVSWYPMEQLAVIGIWAILKRLPQLLKLRKTTAKRFIDWQADLVIGIDAPEFNLGLEHKLKAASITTVHYVSPSVWAWREKRIHKIKQAVDLMLTLFPFELKVYQEHGISAACVGHPLAEMLPIETDTKAARSQLSLADNPEQTSKVLAILPGSRGSEIKFLGELFLQVAERLQQEQPQLCILVPYANDKRKAQLERLIAQHPNLNLTLVKQQSRTVMAAADSVLLASGTATLEALLLKKPMTVAYKVSSFSYAIYSRLVKITHFALPNLLLNNAPVPEFMQDQATFDNIYDSVKSQLNDGLSAELKQAYIELHQSIKLGGGEAAATAIAEFMETKR